MKKKIITKTVAAFAAVMCVITAGAAGAEAVAADNIPVAEADYAAESAAATDSSLPGKYSSKDLGYVTEVKNQMYNDCWAYACLGAFESKLLRDGISVGSMSEQHLNAWSTYTADGKGWQRNYRDSGFASIGPGYLTSWYGGAQESLVGELNISELTGDMLTSEYTEYGTTSIRYLYGSDRDEIKRAIMNNGGAFTSYSHSASCMFNNSTAYYMPPSYSGSYTGHSVEIVGWDDSYSRKKFGVSSSEKPENDGAWLAKGSWGNNNSLGGYFWISYEDAYVFSEKYAPSFTVESYWKITDGVRLEQNEIYGATYEFSYVDRDEVTYINVFDFSNGFNTLESVVFETTCGGADYSVFYIPIKDEKPDPDENSWIELCGGKAEFSGYIRADVRNYDLPLGYGAIGVRIDTSTLNAAKPSGSDGYKLNSLGVSEWKNKTDGTYTFINDSKYGDSFIYYDGNMSDVMDWYKVYNDDEIGGTFVIKAVTTGDGAKVSMLGDVDLNGRLNVLDATEIQKYLAGITDFTEVRKLNADFNNDGTISVLDATEIQKFIAGILN